MFSKISQKNSLHMSKLEFIEIELTNDFRSLWNLTKNKIALYVRGIKINNTVYNSEKKEIDNFPHKLPATKRVQFWL